MGETYYDRDADLSVVRSRRIGILGYGNQGHAHALNLRDSGCDVRVGTRTDGSGRRRAENDRFPVGTIESVSDWADLIGVLLPDQVHRSVYEEAICPYLQRGKMLMFAHGFSVHFGEVQPSPEVDVALVAPVGPGHMMRRLYLEDFGIPAVFAVEQDTTGEAAALCLAYAAALGCARVGVVQTTFAEETETDLFGEQAVLCGGISALLEAGFDTLVSEGYQPELAYFECLHQVKLIVDLIYEGGLSYMRSRISETAEFGDYVSGPRVIDAHVRQSMRVVLADIKDGSFARRWMADYGAGSPLLQRRREEERALLVETVGAQLRSRMGSSRDHEATSSPTLSSAPPS